MNEEQYHLLTVSAARIQSIFVVRSVLSSVDLWRGDGGHCRSVASWSIERILGKFSQRSSSPPKRFWHSGVAFRLRCRVAREINAQNDPALTENLQNTTEMSRKTDVIRNSLQNGGHFWDKCDCKLERAYHRVVKYQTHCQLIMCRLLGGGG